MYYLQNERRMNIAAEIHLEKEKVHPFLAVILRIAQRDQVEVKKTN